MSGVELKPSAGTDGSCGPQTNILLPLGKSTVGRGALLGIADKRVSRNHGLMEVEDGKIKIMPTHTNPTFYQPKGASKLTPIEKDVWQTLQHGDKVGLTPDQHIFEVIIHDRPINPSTQSLQSSSLESSPEKTPQKPVNSVNTAKTDGDNKPGKQQNGDDKIADEEKSTEDEDHKEDKSEKKSEEKTLETKDDEDTNGVGDDSADGEDKEKVDTVKLEDGKEVALPVQKERTLPNWMDKEDTAEGDQPAKPKGGGKKKKEDTEEGETPIKKGRGRPPAGSASKPKGAGKGKGRGRPPKRSVDDDEEEASPDGKETSREKRKKYSEDYVDEEGMEEEEEPKVVYKNDDDWMLTSEEEESDISDWENSQSSKKGKAKAKKTTPGRRGRKPSGRTPTRKAAPRGAGKKKTYFSDSEDEFFLDDEVYVPKPTKRTASRFPASQSLGSGEDDEVSPRKAAPKKKTPKPKKRATPAKKAGKKKKPCEFGEQCYRKNPSHFKEFCHPGDPDYKSPNSSGAEDNKEEEEEKEDCPYGAECYRNNKSHLKQYKHAPPPAANRPKREAAQKKAVVIQGDRSSLLHSGVSDDDGARNTYDDNDSFLDEALMGSEQEEEEGEKKEKGSKSDDSDWDPATGEAPGAKKAKVH